MLVKTYVNGWIYRVSKISFCRRLKYVIVNIFTSSSFLFEKIASAVDTLALLSISF